MEKIDLVNEIIELINSKAEGNYWDFKQCWYESNVDLLHDIICMANSPANRDCYIIIGVKDKTFEIVGIKDTKRKNQQNIIDLLRQKPKWAGGIIPEVYIKTINVNNNELDVLIIKRSDNTPFYLLEDYPSKEEKNKVSKGCIYTRIGDTNTPKNQTANLYETEMLWKRRLGLVYSPSQRAKFYLKDLENWDRVDGIKDKLGNEQFFFYYRQDPDYTIHFVQNKNEDYDNKVDNINAPNIDSNFYYLFAFCNVGYHQDFSNDNSVILYYKEVPLFSSPLECVDEGRTCIIPPEIGNCLHYVKDSLHYLMFEFVFKHECGNYSKEAKEMLERVVPIFENENENSEFSTYINQRGFTYYKFLGQKMEDEALNRFNKIEVKQFINNGNPLEYEKIADKLKANTDLVINFASKDNKNKDEITEYLRIGKMVVEWLNEWRKNEG